ncbi:BglG family transcription antiterminator [Rossellomorea marisflavi]|uniref:BglG family transcription antiterminator n=1 Tax=Rossellomorea marisflavi TaxID=189381 RepID=UPI00204068A2|nr:BglG family transcription antiterminator [Rossellomorea marisflavi]MCM2588303.1 BglG family transcription antiterminator [Rossellomorea marisflavi]MDR4937997.1 BglG family transcription antiterminator [Rossellomorea marisflavi]
MFITSREKAIIELIVKTSGKHTVHSLSAYLNVSGRTIQRNLKSIEGVLKQHQLELMRTPADGLFISGKNENIYRLIQQLAESEPTDETPEERKLRLLVTLLEGGSSFKMSVLANELGISISSLTTILDEVADWLAKFNVTLTRKRGVGVEVAADEGSRRHALASFSIVYFYEEIIDSLYSLQKGQDSVLPVLGFYEPELLLATYESLGIVLDQEGVNLVDSDFVGLVVHICLSIQRVRRGHVLQSQGTPDESREYSLMKSVADVLRERLSVTITEADVAFWSVILRGSKLQEPGATYYDSVFLGHLVKKLVSDVSAKLTVDLTDDFSLYQGLMAHMGPSIFRLQQKMELFNPLTDEIKKKYPVLFLAVKDSLELEFPDMKFPDAEVAYIVLHFGSALLMNEEKVKVDAVIVCPTGIGASKMLASRIKKELKIINPVGILSLNDFRDADPDDYDIVISTVRLPFTNLDYILVSPLLSEEDIAIIQTYVQNNIERITSRKYLKPVKPVKIEKKPTEIRGLLQEIKDVHTSIESILDHFRVYRKQSVTDHFTVMNEMVQQAKLDGLVTDEGKVMDKLMEREQRGGLGIPGTNMGLFHCLDPHVSQLVFQVAHLDKPFLIKGMNGKPMEMKSLLLMLAPEGLSERENEILSLISTSLIENQASMMIYSSTNEAMIYRKLEELFLDYVQQNLIKE